MIPGIDLAGTVEESSNPNFKPGDKVLLNGYGLSETHYGGYAELARVKGDWLVPLPKAFTPAEAMAIGTAGYTAMLCVLALEDAHVTPDKGAVVVTGAAGGVGSVAVALLAKLGFHVIASTGRPEEEGYLKELGASEIIPRAELSGDPRALGKERWIGGVDSVGSKTLANVIASTSYGGAVAACGLAGRHGSADQRGTVHPARHLAARHRFRADADAAPQPGLGAAGARSRREEAGGDDEDHSAVRRAQGGR